MSLDESARHLAQLSRQLNDFTDRVNARLLHIEEELRKAGLGFEYWSGEIEGIDEQGAKLPFRIGWTKGFDRWGFYWNTAEPGDLCPLRDAPRWVRIAAFPHVPELISRLTEMAEDTLRILQPIAENLPPVDPVPDNAAKEDDIPF